jgi:hypothetical protein
MIDHEFETLTHWRIGPVCNRWGWVFCAAEIDGTWFLRWRTNSGYMGFSIYPDYVSVLSAIEQLNLQSSLERDE